MSEVVTILQDLVRLDFPNEVSAGGEGAATCMPVGEKFQQTERPVQGPQVAQCWARLRRSAGG